MLLRRGLLARLGGVAPEPIWQWAVLERVSNGLRPAQIGLHDLAAGCLRVAEGWAQAETLQCVQARPVRAREIWGPRHVAGALDGNRRRSAPV